jgi:multidrug efflux system membrane fusion protein
VRRGAPNGVASTFVYVVNADNTVSVRPVTLGVVDGERVAVTAGLKAGEVVVTEGGDRLRDGAPVILPGAPAAGATRPPGKPGTGKAGAGKPAAPGAAGRSRPRPQPAQ